MAKIINKLSALAVASAKTRGLYGDGGGLYLQVSAHGSKSWVFRFKVSGRTRYMGIGSMNTVSLAEAREAASNCRQLRLQEIDPIEQRHVLRAAARLDAAKTMTFDECRDAYIAAHKAGAIPNIKRSGSTRSTRTQAPCLASFLYRRSMWRW